MASLHTISPITKPTIKPTTKPTTTTTKPTPTYLSLPTVPTTVRRRSLAVSAATTAGKDMDIVPLQTLDAGVDGGVVVGGGGSGGDGGSGGGSNGEDVNKEVLDRAINATIVLAAGSFAITKLLTIDHDYWQGWTIFEILRYAPLHNWTAYEESLKTNPVLAKMVISGVVYSVGDWIAQCYEGKPLFDFDRARMIRSGLTGFALHGSLSHYYYEFCEELFPFHDWWAVPLKVAFDQTVWSAIWNSIYFTVLGFLRFESPVSIFKELKATFFPMLTAGWKLWPFAHLVTYGLIPVEQRLLWVDCVELIWVTILSTYSNEKSEARISEASEDAARISEASEDASVSIPPKE
ncbi:uncharacterized protein LOC141646948 [Silene latifolia]|uniref:uncharacterized protein LOC141646948 n=1 Tax=Silene latifolia TaxID=37657 RepID=UPI003D78387C